MTFDELLDLCSAEALASKLAPTADSTWRKICRTYAKKFNTPLPQVLEMSAEEVALHVFEDNLDDLDSEEHLEQLLDLVYTLDDPEYAAHKEREMKEFDREAERQEIERVKAGRPIHPAMASDGAPQKLNSKNDNKKEASLPTQGAANLSDLNDKNER